MRGSRYTYADFFKLVAYGSFFVNIKKTLYNVLLKIINI